MYKTQTSWFHRFVRFLLPGCLLIFLTISQTSPAAAQDGEQTGGKIIIAPAAVEEFPTVHLNLDVYDSSNRFIPDLAAEEVQVVENGHPLQLQTLERREPGLQVIVAVNAAPVMAAAAGNQTVFAQIQNSLTGWIQSRSDTTADDFSLSTNRGPEAIRLNDPAQWTEALQQYQPQMAQETPGNTSLSQALDLATDPNPRPNMKRAILYITPAPNDAAITAMPNLTSRAVQLGVRVFIWMVESGSPSRPEAVAALQQLADQSGGQLLVYAGKDPLPDLETYLEPLRYTYQATYHSQVGVSGEQKVLVEVQRQSRLSASAGVSFQVDVAAPNPILLAPPAQIDREWIPSEAGRPASLSPAEAEIQILVEFPDQHKRALKASRLYVDGRLAAENRQEPFDRFVWPLENYTESQRHQIKVEVEDSLGLKGASIEVPVEVSVAPPQLTLWNHILADRRLQIGLPVFVVAAGLIGALIATGRISWWQSFKRSRKKASRPQPARASSVPSRQEPPSQPRNKSQTVISWPRTLPLQDAPARLVALSESGANVAAATILLNQAETTLGSDPEQALQVIPGESVDPLHARVCQTPEGDFILADCGSVAGTWINYTSVAAAGGMPVEHGDIVHIGRAAFRFELRTPGAVRQIKVVPYKEDEP